SPADAPERLKHPAEPILTGAALQNQTLKAHLGRSPEHRPIGCQSLGSFAATPAMKEGRPMETHHAKRRNVPGVSRRELLKAGLPAGVALSAWSLPLPSGLWGAEAGPPKRGGILRVKGYDPIHFDNHLSPNFKTTRTLSFVYSKLVRHKVGAGVQPGTFSVE